MALAHLQKQRSKLPIGGDLRKGEPTTPKGTVGRNLKHFRFATADKDLERAFNQAFADQIKTYGGVREIEFYVWADTVEEFYDPCKEEHVASKLIHVCDGVTTSKIRRKDGTWDETPQPCPGGCKWKIKMPIIIPALQRGVAINVHSTSFYDTINLHQNLTAIYDMFKTLSGVKMVLRRAPQIISKPVMEKRGNQYVRTGETNRSEEWLLTIEAAQESFLKLIAQLQPSSAPALIGAQPLALPVASMGNAEEWEEEDEEGQADNGATSAAAIPELTLDEMLLRHCVELKKNERAGKAWFDAQYGRLTFEQKQKAALEVGIAVGESAAIWMDPDAGVIEGEIVHGEEM